ncbi:UbiA family prenyltransferase [Oerskovia sp. M15]
MVTVLAGLFAMGVGSGPGTTTAVTAAVLTGQLSVGWSNDWLDARRDVAVQRADKPVVAGLVSVRQVHGAALVAVGLCVVLSLATGLVAGLVHLVAVVSAWAYNAWLKSTVWSWVPYAVSFGLLPLFVVLAAPGTGWRPLGHGGDRAARRGAHVANTLPDLEDDRSTGCGDCRTGSAGRGERARPAVLVVAVAVVVIGLPAHRRRRVGGRRVGGGARGVRGSGCRPSDDEPPAFALSMAVAAVCATLLVLAGPDVALPG